MKLDQALKRTMVEYGRINGKSMEPYASEFEGLEGVDARFNEFKKQVRRGSDTQRRDAAAELAAAALTFLTDCC